MKQYSESHLTMLVRLKQKVYSFKNDGETFVPNPTERLNIKNFIADNLKSFERMELVQSFVKAFPEIYKEIGDVKNELYENQWTEILNTFRQTDMYRKSEGKNLYAFALFYEWLYLNYEAPKPTIK